MSEEIRRVMDNDEATASFGQSHPAAEPRTPLAIPSLDCERNWLEDFSHKNGQYLNGCIHCGLSFVGHKRRVVCKTCAVQPAPCPFCGSTVKMIPNEIARHGSQFGVPNVDVFYAHCYECGADGPVGDSEIEAIRRWNDRRSAPIVPSEDTTAPQCHVDADCVLNAGHRAPCQDAYGGRILPNHRSGGCCDNIPHPLPPTPDGFYALAAAPTLPPDADGDIANVIACIASEIEDAFAAEDAGEPQTPARIRERAEHLAYVMFPPKSASPVLERLDDEAPTTSKYVRNVDDDPAEQLERDLLEAEQYIEKIHGPLLHFWGTTDPDLLWEVLGDADKQRKADVAFLHELLSDMPMRNEAEADEWGGKLWDLAQRIASLLPPQHPRNRRRQND